MAQASRRKASSSSSNSNCKVWKWFLSGILIGALGGWYLSVSKQITTDLIKEKNPLVDSFKTKLMDQKSKVSKPKFDFYNLLPEMEVEVPVEEIRKPVAKPEPVKQDTNKALAQKQQDQLAGQKTADISKASTLPKETATVYLLQLGSFKSHADADRLKARLAMQGIESDIQNITISNVQGKTSVYRVRSGPYNQAQVQSAHRNLQEAGINGVIMRVK